MVSYRKSECRSQEKKAQSGNPARAAAVAASSGRPSTPTLDAPESKYPPPTQAYATDRDDNHPSSPK